MIGRCNLAAAPAGGQLRPSIRNPFRLNHHRVASACRPYIAGVKLGRTD
ncbi:MAG: hypothetical protein QM757_36470 [Paludibaculum sp.]